MYWCGGTVGRTTDLQFPGHGFESGWASPHSGLGKATGTCVPLSPSNIIWYRSRGSDAPCLWPQAGKKYRITASFMTKLAVGSLPRDRDQLQAQCSLIECGTTLPVYLIVICGNRLVLVLKRNGNLIVNTPLRALGTELIPVSWQSTSRWLS